MKKQLIAIAAIGVSLCCLSACTKTDKNNKYDALNEMLEANYFRIELTITDTFDEDTSLESNYYIDYSDSFIFVEYTIEKFAEISLESPSTDIKTTLIGQVIIKDGTIVTVIGDDAGITAEIANITLSFDESYFKNIYLTDDYIEADVKDESGFLGHNINCTNMSMRASFNNVFSRMEITYTSTIGSVVEYVFEFKI